MATRILSVFKTQRLINTVLSRKIINTGSSQTSYHEWQHIYKLPMARLAAGFNKLKIYQAIATSTITPVAFFLEQAGQLESNSAIACAAVGASGILTLTLASLPLTNLVGIIYINSKEDKVKLAFVDFWGRRRDKEIYIKDLIIDDDDSTRPWFKFYQIIRTSDNDKSTYKLLQKYSVIVDGNRFASIFGE